MNPPLPRIPPPPQPHLDRSTPEAYLASCHAWLDGMREWQSKALPAWIEQSRRHLLERAGDGPADAEARLARLPASPSAGPRQPAAD